MNWDTVTLGEICDLVNGKAYNAQDWATEGVPIIRIQNLNGVDKPFNYWNGPLDREVQVKDGDILLAWSGTPGTSFGAHTWRRGCGVLNQHIFRLDIDRKRITSDWAVTCINHQLHRLISQAHGGVGLQHVTKPMVQGLKIPLPPLPEQRRIAAILDKADAIRRKREEGIRLTEELLRSTFLEMFGDPVTNPKKWVIEKLGDMSSIRRGSSPRPIDNFMGGDVPWIKIGDATKGDFFYITETEDHVTQAGAERSVLLEPGSLVVANSGVSLGFARILKIRGCVHDGWLSLERLDERLKKIYLLRLINSLTDHFRAIAPEGTQPNLNTGIMKDFRIPIPPIGLQEKFERAAYAINDMTAARKRAAAESGKLFDSLVQRAFRGEL